MDVVVGVVGGAHFRAYPEGVLQVAGFERDHTGDAVDIPVAHSQGAADIAQGGFGAQGAEGDDLRYFVVAVLIDDIPQHFVAAVVLEIHIDVGHFLALHIEETLEHQTVLQGVYVGDAEAVEDDAGGGAAADSEQDIVFPDEFDDVPYHEEVVGETGIADDFQFVAQPLHRFRGGVGVALAETGFAYLGQVFVGGHWIAVGAVGGAVAGQVGLAEIQGHIAHTGDQAGVAQGLIAQGGGQIGEKLLHFLGAFDVVGIILHSQPLFVFDGGAGLDADVDVLQGGMMLVDVVGVVGGYQGQLQVVS